MFPKDLHYTETHEWVRLENEVATVGITRHAADQLGDITYVELPKAGESVAAESASGTIESVKATSDLIAPLDGKIVEVNDVIEDSPEVLSEEPYDDGWLIRLKPGDPSQLEHLMEADAYALFVKSEAGEEVEVPDVDIDAEEDEIIGAASIDEDDEDPDEV